MINPITFITESNDQQDDLVSEENIHFSIRFDPASAEAAARAYAAFSKNADIYCCLTLMIRKLLNPSNLRDIAAFLFIPSYQYIDDMPVIYIEGEKGLTEQTSAILKEYLSAQGFPEATVLPLQTEPALTGSASLLARYTALLDTPAIIPHPLFYTLSGECRIRSLIDQLHELENNWQTQNPQLAKMVSVNNELTLRLRQLVERHAATEKELTIQRQYVEVLRSGHAAKELQDYYNNEYEVLPMWYKRFGHIVKVLTGKRTFRSLFRDDVKKYKD